LSQNSGDRSLAGAFAKIDAHEELCSERYRGIDEKLKWIMTGLGVLFIGLLGWMAFQLYLLEPLRVAAQLQNNQPQQVNSTIIHSSGGTGK